DTREGALRFQVEMFLAADGEFSAETMWTGRDGRERIAAPDTRRRGMIAVGRYGVLDGQDRSQCPILGFASRGAEFGRFERLAQHPRNRLTMMHDLDGK